MIIPSYHSRHTPRHAAPRGLLNRRGEPDPGNPETADDAPGLDARPDLDLINWRITVQTDQ